MPTPLNRIIPLEVELQSLARKKVLPTALSSAEMRAKFSAEWHRLHSTSARTLLVDLLQGYKDKAGKILNPKTVAREAGSLKTEGLDIPTARLEMKQLADSLGIQKGDGSIKDITSDARINLKLKTDRDVMQGMGWFIQGNDPAVLDAYPAQELIRIEDREQQRNWPARWRHFAEAVGDDDALRVLKDTGRMIARLDSPIWQALGDGDETYNDTLKNPFPPFAFGSGMGVRDIPYSEALELGLIREGEAVRPQLPDDLSTLLKAA
jgi:hypothetical protein